MINSNVQKVYEYALEVVREVYNERLLACYLIGSLSHGNFSEIASDIDVAFILSGKVEPHDWELFDKIEKRIKGADILFSSRISLFWTGLPVLEQRITSGAFPTPQPADGLFPPFDVLDLLQNGTLLYGQDVREKIRIPTEDDLYIAGVEFLLSYVRTQTTRYLREPDAFAGTAIEKKSKTILFPVRLLYTLRTQHVGNNAEAVEYALAHEQLPEASKILLTEAMHIRDGEAVNDRLLQDQHPELRRLYTHVLSMNAEKMSVLGKSEYARELNDWVKEIENF